MKYKVGDKIRLKGTDSAGTIIDIIIKGQLLIILSDGSKIVEWPKNVVLIEGLVEEETISDKVIKEAKTYEDSIKEAWICPDGYVFKDKNGNVINATMIVLEKKKKEYPKTYEECCKVLEIEGDSLLINTTHITDYERDLGNLMGQLHRLIICRAAYWKIAGEEMGLGKPWEPNDADYVTGRYCIFVHRGNIICSTPAEDCPLTFPTEEMRDAFKENFDPDIEFCKELL